MPAAVKPLGQIQLGTSLTTIYTPPAFPANLQARVNGIWIANTDAAAHTVTLRVGSGTLTVANSLGEAWPIAANTTFMLTGSEWFLVITAGQLLQGLADTASVITVSVYGEEIA